ncbi:MAG: tRNA preQ1(34) S-adenosylmethionine ribosyltransferase-isomerase QueA [Patescibacteria group bacterium]|nr:tRNA preQ1(34) S-adenosylmethionine ribosyltransferase-isomerase QueA [Patescibacteria group bacterium]MDD4610938.1 tRNA preQ1(34) S-adenosylmethionine ribosyltransferase-isomerase QueA [Patescibacteria group bacterium]
MKLSEFDYNLPRELIAQQPMKPRDHSRLLLLDKKTGEIGHKHFFNILDYLRKGDVLVLNNSKVFPARLVGNKKITGGKVEVFLLKRISSSPLLIKEREGVRLGETWQCLVGGLRGKNCMEVEFAHGLAGKIFKNNNDGTWEVKFNKSGNNFMKIIEKIGQTPLPPYIKRQDSRKQIADSRNYQTVYADKLGSVAAPTAGFHFTSQLLKKIKAKGVQIEYVTLHVGLGTFAPVKVDDITKHKMHAEYVEIKKEVAKNILEAKKERRRIIAVGTTSARTLEAMAEKFSIFNFKFLNKSQFANVKLLKKLKNFYEYVNIFIYPGYKFKIVDAMITNFHLPKSTLLMLVSAFATKKNINKAYQEAIKEKYRFYSYGDAMFIY